MKSLRRVWAAAQRNSCAKRRKKTVYNGSLKLLCLNLNSRLRLR